MFAAAIFVLSLVLRLALGLARGGTGQWDGVFARTSEAPHEYLPALPALRIGVDAFLARFAEIAPPCRPTRRATRRGCWSRSTCSGSPDRPRWLP